MSTGGAQPEPQPPPPRGSPFGSFRLTGVLAAGMLALVVGFAGYAGIQGSSGGAGGGEGGSDAYAPPTTTTDGKPHLGTPAPTPEPTTTPERTVTPAPGLEAVLEPTRRQCVEAGDELLDLTDPQTEDETITWAAEKAQILHRTASFLVLPEENDLAAALEAWAGAHDRLATAIAGYDAAGTARAMTALERTERKVAARSRELGLQDCVDLTRY